MTLQQYPQDIAGVPCDLAELSIFTGPFGSAHTSGATVIVRPTIVPIGEQVWKLVSIGFTLGMAICLPNENPAVAPTPFGKLGKLYGGVLSPQDATPPTQSAYSNLVTGAYPNAPFVSPMLPLPNPNLTTVLWDPEVDELPPTGDVTVPGGPLLPVSGSLQLPTPVEITSGGTLSVGLWLTPSLLGYSPSGDDYGIQIGVRNTQYTLTYDDGL